MANPKIVLTAEMSKIVINNDDDNHLLNNNDNKAGESDS